MVRQFASSGRIPLNSESMGEATDGVRRESGIDPVGRALRSLLHPLVVVAIAVLLLNDHYLKAEYPGWLTGKLSDFSGLVFFPLLLGVVVALVTRSRHSQAVASIVTLAWFTAIKTSDVAAALTESSVEVVLGIPTRIIVDPSDLIALPMVAVGWEIWRRVGSSGVVQDRRFRKVAVLAVAAFASMATSEADGPSVVVSVDNTGTDVWAGVTTDDRYETVTGYLSSYGVLPGYRSSDGGVTWDSAAWPEGVSFDRTRSDADGVLCQVGETSICYLKTEIQPVEESVNGGIDWRDVDDGEQLIDVFDQDTFTIDMIVWDNGRYFRRLSDGSWEGTFDEGMTWTAGTPLNTDDVRVTSSGNCLTQEPQHCYRAQVSRASYAASQDGGISWAALPVDAPTPDPWRSNSYGDAGQVRGPACLTESRDMCFRVFHPDGHPLTRLEVSTDQGATWRPSWTPSPRLPERSLFAPQDVAVDERTGNLVVAISTGGVAIRTPAGRWTTASVGPSDAYTVPAAFPPSSWPMAALWSIWTFVVSLAGGMWLASQPPVARSANWRLASTVVLATAALIAIIPVTANYPYTMTVGPSWLRAPITFTVLIVVPVVLAWLLISYSLKHVPQDKVWPAWLWAAGISLLPIVMFQLTDFSLM